MTKIPDFPSMQGIGRRTHDPLKGRGPAGKPFSWSYSKLKNYETCPKRHYHVDLVRDFREEESEALLWGNQVHERLARIVANGGMRPDDIPAAHDHIEYMRVMAKVPGVRLITEGKYAVTEGFTLEDIKPVDWFDKRAWFRSIADVAVLGDKTAFAADWKTGKVLDDSVQLALMAVCIFVHHPNIMEVTTRYIWLKEDAITEEVFERGDVTAIMTRLAPRIQALKTAHETQTYNPKPGYLCRRYCPVTSCPHHGKG
jgi:hypothetical protein